MESLRLIPSEQIIHHRLPKEGNLGNGAYFQTRFFFKLALASHFSLTLVKNISYKVVSISFDFIKGIHLVVDTLCEAEVLSSGFQMYRFDIFRTRIDNVCFKHSNYMTLSILTVCHPSIVLSEKKEPACHKRIGISKNNSKEYIHHIKCITDFLTRVPR